MSHGLAARRYLRARLWLASAMWVPVLAANVVAVVLALALPVLDEHLAEDESLPFAVSAAQQIFGALAAGMITFTGIIFSALAKIDEPARGRVELERRLLDEALARTFPDVQEQAIAGRADRLGLGATSSSPDRGSSCRRTCLGD